MPDGPVNINEVGFDEQDAGIFSVLDVKKKLDNPSELFFPRLDLLLRFIF